MLTGGYVGQVTSGLMSTHGDGGSGFQGVVNSPAAQFHGSPTYLTQTGDWASQLYLKGVPAGAAVYPVGIVASKPSTWVHSMTWPAVRGTTIDVLYLVNSSETFRVSVDGSAPVTDTASAQPKCAGQRYCSVSVRATAGTHRVVLSNDGDSLFFPIGVSGYRPRGVNVSNVSLYGQTMGPLLSDYRGADSDATADMMSPDLVILALGVNDVMSQTETGAQFDTAMNTLIDAAKAAGADVLVVIQPASGYKRGQTDAYRVLESDETRIALSRGLAVFDPWALQGRDPCWYYNHQMVDAVPGYSLCGLTHEYPDIHPNITGHHWLAKKLLPFLTR